MSAPLAIVFDLYGTLLHLHEVPFQREVARRVGAGRRQWADFLRETLLVRPFSSRAAFVDAILGRFPERSSDELRAVVAELLERELSSVTVEPSVRSVVGFWRRRGTKVGLLTNSASPFHEPFDRAGLAKLFDAALFSCDIGRRKPEPGAYSAVLDALGVAAAESLMVGDSVANDVVAPELQGMRALLVGASQRRDAVAHFADLAWMTFDAGGRVDSLLPAGQRIVLGDLEGELRRVELLDDSRQGRYNLVAEAEVEWSAGFSERLFLKRFRHPEAIEVERFVRPLLAEIGIATNRVAVLPGREALLVAREVAGEPLGAEPPGPELAFEIGRQICSGFLFANADFRPRNILLTHLAGRPCLTALDYEYALFDRALDLSDLPERFDAAALMRRPEGELLARCGRRVTDARHLARARRTFFDARTVGASALESFRAGWREVHEAARRAAPKLEGLLRDRIACSAGEPVLIIGTEAYRRALLPLDVRDLLDRVALDPDAACDLAF